MVPVARDGSKPGSAGRPSLYIGLDKLRAQISVEVKRKRLPQCMGRRMEGADALFRRTSGILTLNRLPHAKVTPAGDTEAEVLRNAAEVASVGVPKAQI